MDANPQKPNAATDFDRAELRRNTEQVVARLAERGITVSSEESPERLVRLLDAVEEFEAAVQRAGGDLMVDEPVGDAPVRQPDNAAFELPRMHGDETVEAYTERLRRATSVARSLQR
jgi:hypothetical protein